MSHQAFLPLAVLTEASRGADGLHEECAVAGAILTNGFRKGAAIVADMLRAQNHRGDDGWGIAVSDKGQEPARYREFGFVPAEIPADVLDSLEGKLIIGHTRYATAGGSGKENLQPLQTTVKGKSLFVAHNGNLTNAPKLRAELIREGVRFQSTSDSEVILHLIAMELAETGSIRLAVERGLSRVRGAYSLVILWNGCLIAVRDQHGVRPLSLGRKGKMFVVASETCAFSEIGAKAIREIKAGEILVIHGSGRMRSTLRPVVAQYRCSFEKLYFSDARSVVWGELAFLTRRRLGRQLAIENPDDKDLGDVVIAVPNSGIPAAEGYARELGLTCVPGIVRRSVEVGRSFLKRSKRARMRAARQKYLFVPELIRGKRVIVVDDSIVRGITTRWLAWKLKRAGAKAVHFRSAAPRMVSPCYYGVDTPTKAELIASYMSDDEIAEFVRAKTVRYLSLRGMHEVIGREGYCTSCFTGKYPKSLGQMRKAA